MGLIPIGVSEGVVRVAASPEEWVSVRAAGFAIDSVAPLDFPEADSGYHSFPELEAELARLASAHPDILRLQTIGTSLEGRPLYAVKISDEPDREDGGEPDVLLMASTHAREHLTVEMALAVITLFTEGYGSDPEITNLVEQREVWVLPNVNPDGAEYDIASATYRYWRKNRRPNIDGSYGVDLNRNYGYRWGCCGGSSAWPSSDLYRGTAPFSEPETDAVRLFIEDHPGITAAISFHTYGELVLYPYGYTYDDLPSDMDAGDRAGFVALAGRLAETNGYTAQQASDLYVTSGDTVDWLYGEKGVFAFTFEMFPSGDLPGFYPPASVIQAETARNRRAVLLLAGSADNPRKYGGLGGDLTPPEVASMTVTGDGVLGHEQRVSAIAVDDIAVTLLAFFDGHTLIGMDREAPYEVPWTPSVGGPRRLQAVAYDRGGNASPVSTLEFGVLGPLPKRAFLPNVAGEVHGVGTR
jgi:murein tripeptide amidase MpaA